MLEKVLGVRSRLGAKRIFQDSINKQ